MQPNNSINQGLPLCSILVHSLWLTALGIVLFRLATANTQAVLYVKVFAISGAIVATLPWVTQLIVSTAIVILYKAEVCDLTWLVKSEGASSCCGRREVDEDLAHGGGASCRDGIPPGIVNVHGGYNLRNVFSMLERVNERSGPKLQRNRTI